MDAEQGFSYRDYVSDERFNQSYNEYQDRYSEEIRFSDLKILELVEKALEYAPTQPRILDVGCSTGNLLKHLKRTFASQVKLSGCDLSESALNKASQIQELVDVDLNQMDITNLPHNVADIAIVNAVLYMMDSTDFERSIASLSNCLSETGRLIVFDFAHTFPQELEILESSHSHPQGLRLMFRSQKAWVAPLERYGFRDIEFLPFEPPEDLPRIENATDLISYTIETQEGRRLLFRGALSQPWAHIIARRAEG